jgi:chemotaxis signal transduction protein
MDTETRSFMPLVLGPHWLALEAALVREVVGTRSWLAIPGARAELPGVLAWQGRAVAVVDLAALFRLPALAVRAPRARTLLVELGAVTLALPVDGVREVQAVSHDAITRVEPPHAMTPTQIDLSGERMPVLDLVSWLNEYAANDAEEWNHTRELR